MRPHPELSDVGAPAPGEKPQQGAPRTVQRFGLHSEWVHSQDYDQLERELAEAKERESGLSDALLDTEAVHAAAISRERLANMSATEWEEAAQSATAARWGEDWTWSLDQPLVSAWQWIETWSSDLIPRVLRFHVGDKLDANVTCWRYFKPPQGPEQCFYCKEWYPRPVSYHHHEQECIENQKRAAADKTASDKGQ